MTAHNSCMSLADYKKKRSFTKTPEPRGRVQRDRSTALHFVVQKHDASHLHYDFRLELGGVLKSWAVPKGPSMNPADKRLAMETEDHPMEYVDFEGVIPEGNYGAGDVIVWDTGLYTSAETADPEAGRKKLKSGYHAGEMKIVLLGQKLKGGFALVRMKGRGDTSTPLSASRAWLLVKEKDEFASTKDVTKQTKSVLSGVKLPRDGGTGVAAVWESAKKAA